MLGVFLDRYMIRSMLENIILIFFLKYRKYKCNPTANLGIVYSYTNMVQCHDINLKKCQYLTHITLTVIQ